MTDLHIPNMPLAVFATEFLLDANGNHHIEVIFKDEYGERLIKPDYRVHYHKPEEDCFEGCFKDFQEYINNIKDAAQKVSLGTCANYIFQYFSQFYHLIIRDPASLLGSLHCDANLQFPLDASYTRAVFASWPVSLKDLNEKIAQKIHLSNEDIQTYLNYVDSVITTSTSSDFLIDHFDLSIQEAEEVSTLAKNFQLKQEIDQCHHMPSMVTLVKKESKLENKEESMKLYQSMKIFLKIKLLCMEGDQLEQDPETWLMSIEGEEGFNAHIDENHIFVTLAPQVTFLDANIILINPPEPTIAIPFENEITNLIDSYDMTLFQAVYHRSLTFSLGSTLEIIYRSCQILDAFVLPYNPSYLLAARSTVTSSFVGEKQLEAVNNLKCGPQSMDATPGEPIEKYEGSHKQVSLLEFRINMETSIY